MRQRGIFLRVSEGHGSAPAGRPRRNAPEFEDDDRIRADEHGGDTGESPEPQPKGPRVWRGLLAAAGLAAALCALFLYANSPPPGMPNGESFIVERGATFDAIGATLVAHHLIRSSLFLDLSAKATKSARELQAGTYEIHRGMTTLQIRALLVSGNQLLERITIPEGWTLLQIADLLARNGVVGKTAFEKAAASPRLLASLGVPGASAQGFLYPDTYYFPRNYPAPRAVAVMTANFFKNFDAIDPERRRLSPKELLDKVIMASIVEGEYRLAREAPVIASVFYNRLKRGMRLQSCATVAYVLTDVLGEPHRTRLYDKDLEVPSPFNTYLHSGLPPEPISNPGRVALDAALHPANTPYLYFVLENPKSGEHFFSRDFAEHTYAKYQYLSLYLKSN